MNSSNVRQDLKSLRAWVERQGWTGYDPFDVRAHPLYVRLSAAAGKGGRFPRALLALAYRLEQRYPLGARRLLRTRTAINAKSMGLFARGYLLLARAGDEPARREADRRLGWLLANPSRGHPGLSWGYPFDWQARCFVPAGTPSAVVTSIVADAFRLRHEIDGTDGETLTSIGEFLATGLKRLDGPSGTFCFSYTPIPEDLARVHNANLHAAEFLLWAGRRFGRPAWEELARRAVRYTMADQSESGAWDYWGPPDRGRFKRTVDPYHTGFVLRMLLRAHRLTGDDTYLQASRAGYDYFVSHLLDGAVPRATSDRSHPVNGIAVAETLLTHRAFAGIDTRAAERAADLLAWSDAYFRDPQGFYYYLWSPGWSNRLPMMRWVQAWMFLAFSIWLAGEECP